MPDISAIHGDTLVLTGRISRGVDANGDPIYVDISSGTMKIWFTVKEKATDVDLDAVIRKGTTNTGLTGISIADLGDATTRGSYVITVPSSETSFTATGTTWFIYDVQLLEPGGALSTIASGRLAFSLDVTKATT